LHPILGKIIGFRGEVTPYRHTLPFIVALIATTIFAFWLSYFGQPPSSSICFHIHGRTADASAYTYGSFRNVCPDHRLRPHGQSRATAQVVGRCRPGCSNGSRWRGNGHRTGETECGCHRHGYAHHRPILSISPGTSLSRLSPPRPTEPCSPGIRVAFVMVMLLQSGLSVEVPPLDTTRSLPGFDPWQSGRMVSGRGIAAFAVLETEKGGRWSVDTICRAGRG
jgi:hypothetical protein